MQSVATTTNTVSKQESLTLIRNMIRISVSSICYMRHLFPDECFKARSYGSIEIHQLHCGEKGDDGEINILNEEAFLVTQWLQNGVFKALDSGYLAAMTFILYTKHPISKEDVILETYEFRITYPEGSNVATINDVQLYSKESVKQQASHFIRALIDFCGTLDSIPEDRWVTLQLQYTNNTPQNYEPEYFEAAEKSLLAGRTFPLKVNVGEIKTQEMRMKLRFAGLESLFVDDILETPLPSSKSKPSVLQAKKHIIEDDSSPSQQPLIPVQQQLAADITAMTIDTGRKEEEHSISHQPQQCTASMAEAYVLVKDYIETGNRLSLQLCATALDIDVNIVRDIYEQMRKDKILIRKKSGNTYRYELNDDYTAKTPRVNKKRGLDEETCIDENDRVDNVTADIKTNTPKWNNILQKVQEQHSKGSDRKDVSGPSRTALAKSNDKVPNLPASQMSLSQFAEQKISKVRDPLHVPKAKRRRAY